MNDYDLKLLTILLETEIVSIEQAKRFLHDREMEEELSKTSLGKELL